MFIAYRVILSVLVAWGTARTPPLSMADWHAYKDEKEAFVAGQVGSSVLRINAVSSVALASYLLWALLQPFSIAARFPTLIDWLTLVVPLASACTVLADHVGVLLLGLCAIALVLYLVNKYINTTRPASSEPAARAPESPLPVLTLYRTYLMVLTVFCILAVDFHVFPRQFAKCESWGTSLMDLGVGSFVFSHGIVSLRRDRRFNATRTARRTIPLLLLGLIRVLLVKRTEYPEHVSEYGVHWNFFLTLGIVIPLVDAIQACVGGPFAVAGVVLSALYELVLSYTPLSAWALSDVRDASSLVSLNKEGLVSLPGA